MVRAFLIKYAEIGIKGKNRYMFEDALVSRVSERLARCEGKFSVTKEQGRIYVEAKTAFDQEEVTEALSHVFGIAHICPVVLVEDKTFSVVCRELVAHMQEELGEKPFTFKVFAKRSDKQYPMESPEICVEAGAYVLKHMPNASVDVHHPEVSVYVEIRQRAYVYVTSIPGPGGMPVGTSGRGMLLLSGGIDSPVAGYMMAKRGVTIEAVYFHAPPYTSERAKQKVVDLARLVSEYAGKINLHIVNFTDIQLYIYDQCPHDELTILMRRYMMRIAETIARERNCLSLITGESVGQVASQTMQSLAATDAVCTMPVFRPLIAFDKNEIIEIAERIDTFETSIQPFEDCCTIFVAKHPVTKPDIAKMEQSEEKLAERIDELVETAIAGREIIEVQKQ
ncbi:MAG: tRNA 4-thiouridine(8) synthase ThiI [Lachnospiraceae bacterium]|nr:tRNA 4-thiouridine(8) synthase ThiI [Lachnospiraceae bacterium]